MIKQLLAYVPPPSGSTVWQGHGTVTNTSGTVVAKIGEEANKNNFFGFTCINQLIFNIANLIILVAGLLTFIYLVLGGLDWLMSNGDKVKIDNARSKITNAVLGLAIIAISWAIFKLLVPTFFGINVNDICSANPVG